MKKFRLLFLVFFSLLVCEYSFAQNRDRAFGIFGGFGFGPAQAEISQGSTKSIFSAWQGTAEAGMNVPLSGNFGMTFSGEYSHANLINKANTDSSKETGAWIDKVAKFGFYMERVGFGGGVRLSEIDTNLVSATNGSSSLNLNGTTNFAFANLSFNSENIFRFSLEGQYVTGPLDSSVGQSFSFTLRALYVIEKR